MSIHKIAAKLTVLCAILDERETPDADLPNGRIGPARRLAREASALAAAEQARLEKASAPIRPAEEIARGMVVSTMQNRITGKAVVALLCGGSRVYVDVDSDGEADDLRRLLTRLIEQSRAEGAAAERERLLALPEETPAEQEARHIRAMRAAREAACEDSLYREEQPRDLAVSSRATNCGTCLASLDEGGHRQGCDEPRRAAERQREESVLLAARRWVAVAGRNGAAEEQIDADMALTEAVEALAGAPEKPRDLAGRIRALVQEYAGRWADARGAASDETMGEVVEHLARVAQMVRRGVPVTKCIDDVRRAAVNVPWGNALRQAADELEAIVREHAGEQR